MQEKRHAAVLDLSIEHVGVNRKKKKKKHKHKNTIIMTKGTEAIGIPLQWKIAAAIALTLASINDYPLALVPAPNCSTKPLKVPFLASLFLEAPPLGGTPARRTFTSLKKRTKT